MKEEADHGKQKKGTAVYEHVFQTAGISLYLLKRVVNKGGTKLKEG